MRKINTAINYLTHIFLVILIFLLSIFTSFLFAFWQGYPSGFDAVGHIYRVYFVAQFWPDVNWWPNWAAGMPHFLRYASVPYIALGLITRWAGLSPEQIITGAAVFSIGLGGVGIYFLVNKLSHSKLASLLGAFLYLLTPASWELTGRGGGYSRAYALPFMILAIWAVTVVLDDLNQKRKRYWPYLLSSFFLGLCFLNQYIVGAAAFIFIACWIFSFVGVIEFRRLLLSLVKIFIPAILISAPLWVPMVVFRDPKNSLAIGSINWSDLKPVPWRILFNFNPSGQEINPYDTVKLSPFLYPLLAVLSILGVIFRLGKLELKSFLGRSVWVLILVSALSLVFLRTVTPLFSVLYAGVITHEMMIGLVPIFSAMAIGVLVAYTFKNKWLISLVSILLIIGVTFWAGYVYRLLERGWGGLTRSSPNNVSVERHPLIKELVKNPYDFNFRFGTSTDADLAAWFNIAYPYIPQTRDYFSTGIVNIDDDVYKTHVIWEEDDNYPETEFILDWFGINKFVVTLANTKVKGKYEVKPETFRFLGETEIHKFFDYDNSNPILAPNSSPSVLIIGRNAYDFIYRSFAQGNLNSQYLIPIVGREQIDGYKTDDFKNFDIVFLYDYQYRKKEIAFDALAKYVRNGGKLFIESNLFIESEGNLPEPFPINSVDKISFAGSWDLDLMPEINKVDLNKFSPPVYQDGPWNGAVASGIKNWGNVLVSRGGKPIIVGGQMGAGKVVWSGMNLPYHVLQNHNPEEAKFLGLILAWLQNKDQLEKETISGQANKDLSFKGNDFTARLVNPQEFRIELKSPSKGVLFKEAYFSGWQAKVIEAGGRSFNIPIFKAGPRMMYVRMPAEAKEVVFRFKVPAIITLAKAISWLTMIFLLTGPLWLKLRLPFVAGEVSKFKNKASDWWEKDEV